MTEIMWVRSHVERLLQDEWDCCRVQSDDDRDYPFRSGTAACWVSVVDTGEAPMVRVFAQAAFGIKPTAAMWRELNDIQQRCVSAAVFWSNGIVVVSQTISAINLTQPVLAQALAAVSGVADDIGVLVASMFGGSTPFPAEDPEPADEEAA